MARKLSCRKCGWWLLNCTVWHLYQEYPPSFGQGGRNTAYGAMLHRRGHRSGMVLLLLSQLLLLLLLLLRLMLLCRSRRTAMASVHHGRDITWIVARVIARQLTRRWRRCGHRVNILHLNRQGNAAPPAGRSQGSGSTRHRCAFAVIPLLSTAGGRRHLYDGGRRGWNRRRGVQILQPIR